MTMLSEDPPNEAIIILFNLKALGLQELLHLLIPFTQLRDCFLELGRYLQSLDLLTKSRDDLLMLNSL